MPTSHMYINEYPVDIVYLWCDGADPLFVKKKEELLRKTNYAPIGKDLISDVRFVEHNELLYSLRSVHKNLPWINHIFIVTDNQRPKWLKNHPQITIIDHKQIIPLNLLPTFNSCVIETYIDKIPNLSEHFLYMNDDVFITQRLNKNDFFDENGLPIVRITKTKEQLVKDGMREQLETEEQSFTTTLKRAWLTFVEKNGRPIPFDLFSHSVDAFTKTIFKKVLDKYPEVLLANVFPFRNCKEIQRLLFTYEIIHCLGCPSKSILPLTFWNKLINKIWPREVWTMNRSSLEVIKRNLKAYRPKTLCVNRIDEPEAFNELFSDLFPQKAPWEVNSNG